MMQPIVLQHPRKLIFGPGCALRSSEDSSAAGYRRIFVISSPSAARQGGALVAAWRTAGTEVVLDSSVSREPEIGLFEAVLSAARAFQPDAVVGLGGGSPLDVAKFVAAIYQAAW